MSTNESADAYERFLTRYQEGRIPWDNPSPPPEIVALKETLPAGRALDLGCGYGRTAIFLAYYGWRVDGIDFIPQAIDTARRRATAVGVAERINFHVASAAALDFLDPPYDLAVDIGCMHSFNDEMLRSYRDQLARLLRLGGDYILFARLRDENAVVEEEEPRGIRESAVLALLDDHFRLVRVERGVSQSEDRPPWNSGWFWFRRR
jgi:SAM-dependent methyltransferase